jgi:hypothetical protein
MGLDKGGDDLRSWLKQNTAVLAARPDYSPVFVLRDWEEGSKSSWDKVLESHPYSQCLVCPARLANPELDTSVVGIERFLPTDFVAAHAGSRLKRAASGTGPYSILRPDLATLKPVLSRQFENGGSAGPFLVRLVKWIDTEIGKVLPAQVAV